MAEKGHNSIKLKDLNSRGIFGKNIFADGKEISNLIFGYAYKTAMIRQSSKMRLRLIRLARISANMPPRGVTSCLNFRFRRQFDLVLLKIAKRLGLFLC